MGLQRRMRASLKGALWFLALFLELPQKESPAFDMFVPCLLRFRVLRIAFVLKGKFCSPVWHWLEVQCDPGYVDGFMVPLPREAECLPSVEHGELAPKVPVLFGPGKMICPTYLGLQLCRWRPPFLEQISTCPVVEEQGRAEMGKICHNGDSVSRCFDQFQVGPAHFHVEKPSRPAICVGSICSHGVQSE